MAKFKCKMCGAPLDVGDNQTVAVCSFCGSKQTVANADDERKENLFNRANSLRQTCDFDKALLAYQSILSIFPNEPEAHWGVVLCKYGIEYVDDPKTKKKVPTIHRVAYGNILKDPDYLAAISYADVIAREEYQDEAKQIADIQKNILSISQKEEPFDIFICYKETDEKGKRTPDSVMAQEIYTTLNEKGYKAFFSRITLENKLGTMYEPYIFAALNSAKIMLVIGTKKEYFEAVWVKNEWSRFLDLMQTRPDHYLIPCYKDMDAYEMPESFLSFQAQDLSKLGFMQDLIRGIDKIMGRDAPKAAAETKIIQTDVNVDALLTRAEILIGDGNYEKADSLLERVLDNDPRNSQAYLLKLVIELQYKTIEDLKKEENTLEGKSNFQKAFDFGSDEQRAKLSAINESINNRNEETRLSKLYDIALDYKNNEQYGEAEKAFSEIGGFRDSIKQAAECVKLGKEDIYKRACASKQSKDYDEAIETFTKIIDFKDSEKQISECKELRKQEAYKQAVSLKNEGRFDEASAIFMTILSYNDSDFQVDECARLKSDAQKEAVYSACLFNKEINPYFDASALKQACKNLATIPGYKNSDQLLVKYESILKDYEAELEKKRKEKAKVQAKKVKKIKKVSLFSSIAALGITGVLLLTFLFLVPQGRQNNIQSLIDSGNYDEALAQLQENGSYGDSSNLLAMCKAGQAFESLDYETGIDYIYNIGGAVDVAYDSDGGTAEKGSETIKKKNGYINNDSDKDGYTFHGWKQIEYTIKSSEHYASIDLLAQYQTIAYTFTFNLNGGVCSNLPSEYNTEEAVSIPNPTRTGYTFKGWTGSNLETPTTDYVLPVGSVGNKTYTANWQANEYKIYLNSNGGESAEYISVTYDSNYTLPTPIYTGYVFKGWFDSLSVEYSSGKYTIADDLHVTAKWQIITYAVTYNLNGGVNNSSNPTTYVVTSTTYTLKDPTRTGYSFLGWTTSSVTNPTKGLVIEKGTIGDLAFTANWQANQYAITIDPNGGEISVTSFSFTYDQPYSIPTPTRIGYSFVDFQDESGYSVGTNGTWTYAGNATFKATWQANSNTKYVVNYHLEKLDGSGYDLGGSDTKYGTSDSSVYVYPTSYDGFTPDFNSKQISINPAGTTVVDFYCSRNSYTLSFVTNGGASIVNKTMKYEEVIPTSLVAVRDGYTFSKWCSDVDQLNSFEKMPASNASVYAYYSQETPAGYFSYSYNGGESTITGNKGLTGNITVPEYINDKLVTEIGDNAFLDCVNVTKFALPENVETVGKAAFKGCTSLEQVLGTSNLNIIKESTFEGCRVLSVFPNPSNVTYIGDRAFKDCASLTTLTFHSSLSAIGNYAFSGCSSLLATPDLTNVTSIGDYAFEGCTLLTEIKSLDGCATFGEGVFTACENIAKLSVSFKENVEQFYVSWLFGSNSASSSDDKYYLVTTKEGVSCYVPKALIEIDYNGSGEIPDYFAYNLSSLKTVKDTSLSTTKIGISSFEGCVALDAFTISNSEVASVGDSSFKNCSILSALPAFSLSAIGNYAFSGCSSLLATPDLTNVTSIGDYAFEGCTLLTEIKSLDGCATFGEGVFTACENIAKLSVSFKENVEQFYVSWLFGSNSASSSDDKYYLVTTKEGVSCYVPKALIEIDYNGSGEIPDYFAYNLSSLKTVKDTSLSTTKIGISSFEGCVALDAFTISNSEVASVGDSSFKNCSILSALPAFSLSAIGNYAFSGCSSLLATPDLTNVTSIGDYAFEGCTLLTEIKSLDGCATFGEGVFTACENIAKLSVSFKENVEQFYVSWLFGSNSASSSDDKYYLVTTKEGVSCYVPKALIEIDYNGSGEIPDYFAYNLSSLKTVKDTSLSTTKIGISSFEGCVALDAFTISNSEVASVGDSSFKNCSILSALPAFSLSAIGNYAFSGCSSLLATPDLTNVTSIGDYAFYNCDVIANVSFGNNCNSVGNFAFAEMNSLTSIVSLGGISSVGNNAFQNCVSLLNIPDLSSIETFGDKSFYGCSLLSSIKIENDSSVIGKQSFGACLSLIEATIPFGDETFFYYFGSTESFNHSTAINIGDSTISYVPSSLATINAFSSTGALCDKAFYNISQLTTITFDDSFTSIGAYSLYNCSGLSSLSIPNTVISISTNAFAGCGGLTSISVPCVSPNGIGSYFGNTNYSNSYSTVQNGGTYYIPSNLTSVSVNSGSISAKGLANMASLTSATFGDSVTSIGDGALNGCTSLVNLTIPFVGKSINATGQGSPLGWIFGTAGYNDIFSKKDQKTSEGGSTAQAWTSSPGACLYSIPSSLKNVAVTVQSVIPDCAFRNCDLLEEIAIPNNASSIGSYLCQNCTSLIKFNSGVSTQCNIPEGILAIGDYAFFGCEEMTVFTMPDSITSIGSYAFSGCSSTLKFNSEASLLLLVPSSCETIGDHAFQGMALITSATFGDSVTSIGDGALNGCTSLVNLTIPFVGKSINATGQGSPLGWIFGTAGYNDIFSKKDQKTSEGGSTAQAWTSSPGACLYSIPSSLKNVAVTVQSVIPDCAFRNCDLLEEIAIPNNASSIGSYLCQNCTSLIKFNSGVSTQCNIPEGILAIGDYAFFGCEEMTVFTMPDSITSIGSYAFSGCSSTLKFNSEASLLLLVPSSCETIGDHAFQGMALITSATFGDSVTSIGDGALNGCTSLVNLTIPFVGKSINATGQGSPLGWIFGTAGYNDIFSKKDQKTSEGGSTAQAWTSSPGACLYSIPSSLKNVAVTVQSVIPDCAFRNCDLLEEIAIPNNASSIGSYLCQNCTSLIKFNSGVSTQCNIPEGILAIGDYAFFGCEEMTVFTMPDSITSIGSYAFSGCSSTLKFNSEASLLLLVPSSCETIGDHAFQGMALITSATFGDSVTSIGDGALNGCTSLVNLTIPFVGKSINATGQGSPLGWIFGTAGYNDIFSKKDQKTSEGGSTAQAWTSSPGACLYSIPSSLKNVAVTVQSVIPDCAFRNCDLLEEIAIPNNASSIGSYLCQNCTSLIKFNSGVSTQCNIPEGILAIGDYAFFGCEEMTVFTMPDSITSIGSYAFSGCSSTLKFNSEASLLLLVPSSCETIGDHAFQGMALITSATFGDSVTSIGDGALNGCTSLVNLTIPFVGKSINATGQGSPLGWIFGTAGYNDIFSKKDQKTSEGGSTAQAWTSSPGACLYSIPSSLKNVAVTVQSVIPDCAFRNCDLLEEIELVIDASTVGIDTFTNCIATVSKDIVVSSNIPWNGSYISTSFSSGTGTSIDPYIISSPSEFAFLSSEVSSGKTFEGEFLSLKNNLNFNGKNFSIIGTSPDCQFKGTIMGNGHSIRNIYVSSSEQYAGLFGYFDGSIKQISFENINIVSTNTGSESFTGLFAYVSGNAEIVNCKVTGLITGTNSYSSYVGGIAGYCYGSISNCYVDVDVISKSSYTKAYAGGAVGFMQSGQLFSLFVVGNVSAAGNTDIFSRNGGIVGDAADNSLVSDCYRTDTQILTKYGTVSKSYNNLGTVFSYNSAYSYVKAIWNVSIWNLLYSEPKLVR